jgi:uncharacterized membrane protein
MRAIPLFALAFLVATAPGCMNKSKPGGGPARASSFTIDGPAMTPSIKQGDAQTVSLKVNRGADFHQAVKLKADAPTGIDVSLSDTALKPADKNDVNLKVAVGNNAAPGEHIIHVVGTPDQGTPTTLDLKVKVTEKADNAKLALKGPATTTVKQGETKTVKVHLDPNSKYLVPVQLHADSPKGIKTELTTESIKASEGSDAELRITADKNAEIGEHTIHITGKGDAATITPLDVKVKVVAR